MSRTINKVILIGNLGSDPEVRATSSGSRVASVSRATSDYRGKDKDPKTNWHRLAFWGRLVEVVEKHLKKGDRIYVEGAISYSRTEAPDGTIRDFCDIIVRELTMLGNKKAEASSTDDRDGLPF